MELLGVARILWARRILVALGIIAAVGVGLLVGRMGKPQTAVTPPGVGQARLVMDTTHSQLVEAAPKGADTLSLRASLLADTLATSAGTSAVARAAGVDPRDLAVLVPAATKDPTSSTPLVDRIVKVTSAPHAPYVVNVMADEAMPVLTIEAYAPDDAHVARLTRAVISALRAQLVAEDGTGIGGFVLDTVVPPRIEHQPVSSHAAVKMLAAAVFVFGMWCLSIVLAVALWRRWRRLGQPADVMATRQAA
jgi:hypothetical protein